MTAARILNLTRLGWTLAICVSALTFTGLAAIHATDQTRVDVVTQLDTLDPSVDDSNWFEQSLAAIGATTLRQALYFVTGVGLMLMTIAVGYRRLGRWAWPLYWIIIFLLVMLVLDRSIPQIDIPLIEERRDTWRWISLGPLSLQPSEFMKFALILALASYLRFRDSYRTWRGLAAPFVLTLLPMGLIVKQPDLGTTLMLLPVLFAMLFVAGARIRHLAVIVMLGLASLPVIYFYGMKDYQRQRVQVLWKQNIDDERWHMNEGYQLRQALIALGSGGVWGEGWKEGAFTRYELLPESHNDCVFALVGNQWGLIGAALVIVAYIVIVISGLEVAARTRDPLGRLCAVGVVTMIVVQALLNICMNIGLAPITGMTLPFVSAGGSSLWANFIALGLLVSVAQHRPMLLTRRPFEHED